MKKRSVSSWEYRLKPPPGKAPEALVKTMDAMGLQAKFLILP